MHIGCRCAAFAAAICRRWPLVGRELPWDWAFRLPLAVRLSPRPIVTCKHNQHAHAVQKRMRK